MTKRASLKQFWDTFRDLPAGQKIGAIGLVAACIYVFAFMVLSWLPDDNKLSEENISAPPVVSTPSASSDPTAPTATQEANNRPVVGTEQRPEVTGNKLSVAESRKAAEAAEKGVQEFINWKEGESVQSRQKRIDAHFTSGSRTKTLDPLLENEAKDWVDSGTNKSILASFGKTVSTYVVGGDNKLFRVNIGVTLRHQNIDPSTGQTVTAVKETNPTYTVDLTKGKNGWKITEIVNE